MAIVTPEDFLSSDGRFRRWGKLVLGLHHIDLSKKKGFALTGPFVKWDASVALGIQQFLVVAAETGSHRFHDYGYALVEGGESPRQVLDKNGQRCSAWPERKGGYQKPRRQHLETQHSTSMPCTVLPC